MALSPRGPTVTSVARMVIWGSGVLDPSGITICAVVEAGTRDARPACAVRVGYCAPLGEVRCVGSESDGGRVRVEGRHHDVVDVGVVAPLRRDVPLDRDEAGSGELENE